MIGSDVREQEKSQDENAQRQKDLIVSYKRTFSSDAGREALRDMMDKFHILNSHKGDAFAEGQRSVVLHILAQTMVSLREFEKLIKGDV